MPLLQLLQSAILKHQRRISDMYRLDSRSLQHVHLSPKTTTSLPNFWLDSAANLAIEGMGSVLTYWIIVTRSRTGLIG